MNRERITGSEELQHLLPWYVNGTLDTDERQAVEALLRESMQAQEEVEFLRAIAAEVKSESPPPHSELGWQRLRQAIHKEPRPVNRNWWKPGLAAAAALVIALQSGLLVTGREDTAEAGRLLSNSPFIVAGEYWLVQVMFAEDSQWQALMALIDEANATLVDGPSSLGLVRLAVDKDNALFSNSSDLLTWLERQPQVVHVALEQE